MFSTKKEKKSVIRKSSATIKLVKASRTLNKQATII